MQCHILSLQQPDSCARGKDHTRLALHLGHGWDSLDGISDGRISLPGPSWASLFVHSRSMRASWSLKPRILRAPVAGMGRMRKQDLMGPDPLLMDRSAWNGSDPPPSLFSQCLHVCTLRSLPSKSLKPSWQVLQVTKLGLALSIHLETGRAGSTTDLSKPQFL